MRNFIKFFLIFLSFLIILAGNQCFADVSVGLHHQIISCADEELNITPNKTENAITSSNAQNKELISFNDRKNSFGNGLSGKASLQNKLLQYYFYNQYNQLYISSSHKISSYLKNEICTRAP